MSTNSKKMENLIKQYQKFEKISSKLNPIYDLYNSPNFQLLCDINRSPMMRQIISIQSVLNKYNSINQQIIKLTSHKSYYNYINISHQIIKSYPNLNQINNINTSLQGLDLNLPYHLLKNSENWKHYQYLMTLSSKYSSLAYSLNLSKIYNNISNLNLELWLENIKKNKDFILSYNAFKNSELGKALTTELVDLNDEPRFSLKENKILFFIFTGFIISFYNPNLSIEIYDYAISLIEEITNNKIISSLGTLYLLKDLSINSKNIISDVSYFCDND